MISAAILFPKGSEFFNVEGVPVVLSRPPGKLPYAIALEPGKPPRPFPFESVMRNGSPVTEDEFRAHVANTIASAAIARAARH